MKKDGRSKDRDSKWEGLSSQMVHNCRSLCFKALEKAIAENLIVINLAVGCKLPPLRRKEMQVLSREEMQKLLIQTKDEGYYEKKLSKF